MKKNKSGLWGSSFEEIGAILKALEDAGVTSEDLSLLKSDKKILKKVAAPIKSRDSKDDCKIKAIWQRIYKEWFGLEKDFSNLKIPTNYNSEEYFAVIVVQDLTMNEVFAGMRKRFEVYSYIKDLDVTVKQNDRTAENGDYIVLFDKNTETKKGLKDLLVNELKEEGHQGITLMERLLLEILYFNETKKHLKLNSVVLCSGSRYRDNSFPQVNWYSDSDSSWLYVGWCKPGDSNTDFSS